MNWPTGDGYTILVRPVRRAQIKSKSEDSYFPALAKFICENLEISEFENDKARDPKTTFH